MTQKIVSKFGGTSMGDANCMRRSAQVALSHHSNLVVVSATSGTTNQLIEMSLKAEKGHWDQVEQSIGTLKERHNAIARDIDSSLVWKELESVYQELSSILRGIFYLRDCSPRAYDAVISFGELLSSRLFVGAMQKEIAEQGFDLTVDWWDAREIIRTDSQHGRARPLNDKIKAQVLAHTRGKDLQKFVFVSQGFIGRGENGAVTTLGRGGSDYSAAIFAEAIDADILEIWTDVPGIATTDPRIVSNSRIIPEISFKEASELATFGAKVLHPATLEPAIRKNIPVLVASSFEPERSGTWIRQIVEDPPLIRALALRKKQLLLTLTTPQMLHAHGFLLQIFRVFNEHKISVDAITTSEISVSLTIDEPSLASKNLFDELRTFAEVQIEEGLCLVSMIGNNVTKTPGLAKKIFDIIPDINVRMICLGASKHNFCFLVDESQGTDCIQRLHAGLKLHEVPANG